MMNKKVKCVGASQGREDNRNNADWIEASSFCVCGFVWGRDSHNYNTIITQTHILTVLPACQLKSEKKTFFVVHFIQQVHFIHQHIRMAMPPIKGNYFKTSSIARAFSVTG